MAFNILESGEGDAILFLPGSFSTTSAWAGVWNELPEGYRLLSVNLPGYGGANDPRIGSDSHMDRLTDWLHALLNKISEPVHLVGHSFGGQIALAAMLKGRANVRSLTTFEANPVFVLPNGDPFPWIDDVRAIAPRLAQAHRLKGPDAAGIVIDYWTSEGSFAAMPDRVRDFCNEGVPTNLRDWDSAMSFAPMTRAFRNMNLPATLTWGSRASDPIAESCRAIAQEWPHCATRIVEGADHFLISTHPEACASITLERVSSSEGR